MACENLLLWGRFQDECLNDLTPQERREHGLAMNGIVPEQYYLSDRDWGKQQRFVVQEWNRVMSGDQLTATNIDEARVFTTINNRALRERFCREYKRRFPNDHDNGCPVDRPPPATIVTEDGDVPLTGPWPSGK
jgi:hypothetical protein